MTSLQSSFMGAFLQFFPRAGFLSKGKQPKARMASSFDFVRRGNSIHRFAITTEFGILESDRKYFLTDVFCPMEKNFGNILRERNLEIQINTNIINELLNSLQSRE